MHFKRFQRKHVSAKFEDLFQTSKKYSKTGLTLSRFQHSTTEQTIHYKTLPICATVVPKIPSNYRYTINNQTKHCETWRNLNTINRDCTNICLHRCSKWTRTTQKWTSHQRPVTVFYLHESCNNSTRSQHIGSKQNSRRKKASRLQILLVRMSYCV